MKKKKIFLLILPILALILEIIPCGAVCVFANPDGEVTRKLYSYFSLVPYGYANFSPLIVGVLTCIITALTVIYLIKRKRMTVVFAEFLTWICASLSLCPLIYGTEFYSVVGGLISASLFLQAIIIHKHTLKTKGSQKCTTLL